MVSHSWSVSASWSVSTSWVAWPSELCTMGFSDVLSACRSWFSWVVIPWCHNWFFNGGSNSPLCRPNISKVFKNHLRNLQMINWHDILWHDQLSQVTPCNLDGFYPHLRWKSVSWRGFSQRNPPETSPFPSRRFPENPSSENRGIFQLATVMTRGYKAIFHIRSH